MRNHIELFNEIAGDKKTYSLDMRLQLVQLNNRVDIQCALDELVTLTRFMQLKLEASERPF